MAIKKIEHVGIQTRDIEASIAFYRDVIGMELKGTLDHTNGVIKLAFLGFKGADETELELIFGYNDYLPTEGKVHHIAFTVDALEPEVERLKSLGVQTIDTEITTLPNGSRYFFFHGPDGEWIELFQSTRG
ncbi:VOC family protein [Tumebacillus permanentifrigoris]|uniref:Lactoylglutathione lyase n=1 Tax=Tumebacillus permanentifrigoris TaxID=378543 RepID=A0A316DCL3_9BACL|nr:VOC family protein [Tumebacillus permanentifrigoris]PWK15951.1 lactoylglutathione lyase [Tumebacillus permanentifrigoris]